MKTLTLRSILAGVLTISVLTGIAQVREIKSASKGGGKSREGGGSSGGSDVAFDLVFYSLEGIGRWQRHTLLKRDSIPSLVSLEAGFQAAAQPSSYYILNPRFRANWGLFSTDIRVNYLVEEAAEGPIHLRTVDWQVIQMNLVTTQDVIFRVGGGFMYEAYGYNNYHTEITAALQLLPRVKKIGGGLEFRGAEVRKEISGGITYELGSSGRLRWYGTLGAAFQRYYSAINVWGIQAGLSFKIF